MPFLAGDLHFCIEGQHCMIRRPYRPEFQQATAYDGHGQAGGAGVILFDFRQDRDRAFGLIFRSLPFRYQLRK
ncbi:MAG: hypothetical protein WCY11_02520 [Novosphingobium sp.]